MSHARRTRRLGSVNTRRGGRWEKARLGLGAAAERTLEDGSAVNQVSGPGHASRVGVPRVNTRIWHDILSPSFPRASHPCKSVYLLLLIVSKGCLRKSSRVDFSNTYLLSVFCFRAVRYVFIWFVVSPVVWASCFSYLQSTVNHLV